MVKLSELFSSQQSSYASEPYLSLETRKSYLKNLKQLLNSNVKELVKAVNKDFSIRSAEETLLLELFPTLKAIDYCLKNLKNWMKVKKKKVPWYLKPAEAQVFAQPLGVIGIIVPWNYPIYLSLVPMIYALAAGNRVLIKFSELTPHTGAYFENLFAKAKLPVGAVTGGKDLGQEFAALAFAKLLFTGSAIVAKDIMKTASQNLTPLVLELGGKSPVLIGKSSNHKHFERIFIGKCLNAGQTCIAPDYVLLPEGLEAEFIASFYKFIEKHYPNIAKNHQYSNIISEKHGIRLKHLLEDAEAKGAKILNYSEKSPPERIEPAIVLAVNFKMQLMQEEIFGPILPVMTYKSFSEAINIIRERPKPLTVYYFGTDVKEISQLKKDTLSGGLVINDSLSQMLVDDLPFGGVGESGFGEYHGEEGFIAFSKVKPIFIQKQRSMLAFFYPPYGKLYRYFLRYFAGIRYDG